MSMISRRSMLAGSPCLLAVSATAGVEDPILPHYRDWCAAVSDWDRESEADNNGNFTSPASLDAERREDEALEAMLRTPAMTMEGMAALLHVLWRFTCPGFREDVPEYAREMQMPEHQVKLALWRSATGLSELPDIH